MNQPVNQQTNQANIPQRITLRSGQIVEIRSLPWGTYKRVKSRLIDAIGGEIGKAIGLVANSLESAATNGTDWIVAVARSGVADTIPQLLVIIDGEINELIEDLIEGCCRIGGATGKWSERDFIDFTELHALDVIKLRNLLLENPELKELFDAEKNCYLGAWKNVANLLSIGTSQTPGSDGVGGSDTSTQSPVATTGDQES